MRFGLIRQTWLKKCAVMTSGLIGHAGGGRRWEISASGTGSPPRAEAVAQPKGEAMRKLIEYSEDRGKTWHSHGNHEARHLSELRARAVSLLISLWAEGNPKGRVRMGGKRISKPSAEEIQAQVDEAGEYFTEDQRALIAGKGKAPQEGESE